MKPFLLCALAAIAASCTGGSKDSCQSRDLDYERYCDSIWESNPDYYNDVLSESDEYISYIKANGSWWKED